MKPHIGIICNIERIWPYNNAGHRLFGINWSVTIAYDPPAVANEYLDIIPTVDTLGRVEPWRWAPVQQIAVWIEGPNKLLLTGVVAAPSLNPIPSNELRAQIVQMSKYKPKAAPPPDSASGAFFSFSVKGGSAPPDARTLHNWMADLSTRPAIVQQSFNLARCFWVNESDLAGASALYAAPVVRANDLLGDGTFAPSSSSPPVSIPGHPDDPSEWDYKFTPAGSGTATVELRSYLRPVGTEELGPAAPAVSDLVNREKLWVKSPQPNCSDTSGDLPLEWRQDGIANLLSAIDLPNALLAAAGQTPDPIVDAQAFQRLVLNLLRSITALRVEREMDGRSLLAEIRHACNALPVIPKNANEEVARQLFRNWLAAAIDYANRATQSADWLQQLAAALLARLDRRESVAGPAGPVPPVLGQPAPGQSEPGHYIPGQELLNDLNAWGSNRPTAAPARPRPSSLGLLEEIREAIHQPYTIAQLAVQQVSKAADAAVAVRSQSIVPFFSAVDAGNGNEYSVMEKPATSLGTAPPSLGPNEFYSYFVVFPVLTVPAAVGNQLRITFKGVPDVPLLLRRTAANRFQVRWEGGAFRNYATALPLASVLVELRSSRGQLRFTAYIKLQGSSWNRSVSRDVDTSANAFYVELDTTGVAGTTWSVPFWVGGQRADVVPFIDLIPARLQEFVRNNSNGIERAVAPLPLNPTSLQPGGLPDRLRSAAAAPLWRWITSGNVQTARALQDRFQKGFEAIVEKLTATTPSPSPDGLFPTHEPFGNGIDSVSWIALDAIRTRVASQVISLVPKLVLEKPQATGSPPPLVFQVAEFARSEDTADVYRKLSGFIVLLRTKQDGAKWRCLNMARIVDFAAYKDDLQQRTHTAAAYAASVPVPARLHYTQEGDRQVLLQYDANPIVAADPLSCIQQDVDLDFPDAANNTLQPAATPIFFYDSVDLDSMNPMTDWARLPALKFGRRYEALVCAIPNSGVLPAELALPVSDAGWTPFTMRLPSEFDADKIGTEYIRCLQHFRTVPISPPDLFSRSGNEISFPALPDTYDVVPLDREMERDALYAAGDYATYFSTSRGTSGSLDFSDPGWSLSLDGIVGGVPPTVAVKSPVFTPLELSLEIVGPSGMLLRIAIARDGSTVTVAHNALQTSFNLGNAPYFDVELQPSTADPSKISVVALARTHLFGGESAQPASGNPLEISVLGSQFKTSFVRLSIAQAGQVITFRRPRFTRSAGSATTASASPAHCLLGGIEPLQSGFSFVVERPKVDIDTWDQWWEWGNGDPLPERVLRIADHRSYRKGCDDLPKIALADPAVVALFIELVPILVLDDTRGRQYSWFQTWSGAKNPFDDPTKSAKTVEVRVEPNQVPNVLDANADAIRITILNSEIWELRLYSCVLASDFNGAQPKFHPSWAEGERTYIDNSVQYLLLPPLRIRIESPHGLPGILRAADASTTASRLLASIRPAFLNDGPGSPPEALTGDQLTLTLARDSADIDAFWPFVRPVEVHLQEWRWLGRPENPDQHFPFSFTNPQTLDWEEGAFYGRGVSDIRRIRAMVSLYDPLPVLFKEDIRGDLRLLYNRYALRVLSRYQDLVADSDFRTALDDWRREIVPCRWNKDVPVPLVRLVLPLTHGEENETARRGPGVLIILDEPWYTIGGLAERLNVALVSTSEEELRLDKDPATGKDIVFQEFGPDPILTGEAWDGTTERSIVFTPEDTSGPIGHTYDFFAANPKYRVSSFMVRLPQWVEKRKIPWPFARLKFQRELDPRGMAKGLSRRTSKWTPPVWIQFVPDATDYPRPLAEPPFDTTSVLSWEPLDADYVHLLVNNVAVTFELNRRRTFGAVLTEVQTDAFGQPQESYIGLFLADTARAGRGTVFRRAHPQTGVEFKLFRLRLIEIQTTPGQTLTADNIWINLFPTQPRNDAKARIVRVSRPIDRTDNVTPTQPAASQPGVLI